jgi:hypothetical protein
VTAAAAASTQPRALYRMFHNTTHYELDTNPNRVLLNAQCYVGFGILMAAVGKFRLWGLLYIRS